MSRNEICFSTATSLAQRIRKRDVAVREVIAAHLAQIERVNPTVNAIVTLTAEAALDAADAADAALARGEEVGALHGLPVVIKDLHLTKGIRTTFASPIYADYVPDQDELIVQRLKDAGAIVIGKSNTPEFGAGSQTFNTVFGATSNPYDTTKTCGGSSGGAAVALACGMVPLADGSDMGGSLRNPASYCNIVGLRPSPGRVPTWPSESLWATLSVQGPMARTAQDVALMLSVIAGPDARVPISIDEAGERFRQPLERDFRGVRLAWSSNLGELPIDPQVTAALAVAQPAFAALGIEVEEAHPDLRDADAIFKIMRGWSFSTSYSELLTQQRHKIKDTVVWNIEAGLTIIGSQLGWAERQRSALFQRVHEFFRDYEFLALPVAQVPPFDIHQPYITAINGVQLETYIDWMRSCYYITTTSHPAISVPCGFTPDGLPVGVQIVGRHRSEFSLLQLAHAFEQVVGAGLRRPPLQAIELNAERETL